jgi:hypothetical protein
LGLLLGHGHARLLDLPAAEPVEGFGVDGDVAQGQPQQVERVGASVVVAIEVTAAARLKLPGFDLR